MRERRAQVVLLVRAFEETDRDGAVLPHHAREAATRRAMMVTGLSDWEGNLLDAPNMRNGETVMRRARLLYHHLVRKVPVVQRALQVAALGAGTAPTIVLVALVVGLLTNVLGPSREINLLSFPLFVLLLWNVMVFVGTLVAAIARGWAGRRWERVRLIGGRTDRLAGVFMKGALWRRLHGRKIEKTGSMIQTRIVAKALVRFGALWHRLAGALLAARVRRMLHYGAMAMVVGAVAGMYIRGIAFEYRATWESTWLDAAQVQGFLDFVLGPAAAVLGVEVPPVAALRGPEGSGDAAPWIHLFAMTAVLFVIIPRGALAVVGGLRARRIAARIPVDLGDLYFRNLFTAWRGARKVVDIVPYSFRPGFHESAALKTLLFDVFGARADIRVHEPLGYGEDPPRASQHTRSAADREYFVVCLFNLAQSPEPEVHGAFLEAVKSQVEPIGGKMVVIIDTSSYRERVGVSERSAQRLRAWERLVGDSHLAAVPVDLGKPADDDILIAVGESLWPRENAEVT